MPCNSCSRQQRSGKEAVMTSLRIVAVSFVTAILMWTGTASAEYNATKLRQVAGRDLDSLHLMARLETPGFRRYLGKNEIVCQPVREHSPDFYSADLHGML